MDSERALLAVRVALVALVLVASPLRAQQGEYTEVPLALTLNGEPRGDIFARLAADGGVWVRLDDFGRLNVKILGATIVRIDGIEHVRVDAIPNARAEFDERALTLALNLPPESFEAQQRRLTSHRSPHVVTTQDDSAFLNYRLAAAEAGAARSLALVNELGARRGEWLFLSGSQFLDDDAGSRFARFQTRLIRDERELARRWIVGDAFTPARDLGSTLNLGGVSLSRTYQIAPYLVHSPTATFAGSVATPADVEVFVGGTRVYREQLAPGAYELRDFNYYGGRQDVRIVVRDALGQQQVVEYPYYFTDRVLAAGLQEYGYHAGALRRNYGLDGGDYGGAALSGSHRYGLNDRLTIGAQGEYGEGRLNFGPEAALRSDTFGVVSAALSWGRDPDAGGGALGWTGAWQYQYGPANVRLAARGMPREYGLADPLQNATHLTQERLAAVGYGNPRWGYANVQWLTRAGLTEAQHHLLQLNYSRTLYRRISLFANVQRDSAQDQAGFFAGLMGWFGNENNASVFHSRTGDADSQAAQASNIFQDRPGVGYRLTAENVQQPLGDYQRVSPYVEANLPTATYSAEVSHQTSSVADSTTAWQLAMQGSLYSVRDQWGLGRRINDGFALARVTPPLEDVRVYYSGREVGRTGREGTVLLPAIASFLDNAIGIEDEDVPIDYTIQEVEKTISPPFRAGSLVEFRLGVNRNLVGHLVLETGAGTQPLEYAELVLQTADGELKSQTGAGGEFYLENVLAGEIPGSVRIGERTCRFVLAVPEQMAPVIEIADPVICAD